MGDVLQPGKKEAKRAAREQQRLLGEQQRKERQRALEAEDEIARRRAAAQGVGGFRRSLLTGGETGQPGASMAQNLGG